jgi:hypothetical protein
MAGGGFGAAAAIPVGATRIITLLEAVELGELEDDAEYGDILEDMKEECNKYGQVRRDMGGLGIRVITREIMMATSVGIRGPL